MKKKTNPGGGSTPQDRISELPVEILHHILGLLEMDELVIGTSLVSTKWKNLWKSVSILKFPNSVVVDNNGGGGGGGGGDGIRSNVEKYHNFVDHVLRLRDSQSSSIRIFKYYCVAFSKGGYDDYFESLHKFIVSAVVNQGAQEIQILGTFCDQSSGNGVIHFNPSIFTSRGLLRKFNFEVFDPHFRIQFPRSMCSSSSCATQLTHLSLTGIRLPESDDAQFHLVYPLLETFHMSNCYSKHLKVLGISAPRLVTLCIYNYGMGYGNLDALGGCRIEIRTPNLTSLRYFGSVYVDCFTENLPRLADARLHFRKERGMVKETTSFGIKLLKGLTSAESLSLEGFEVFSEDVLKELLTPFTRLRTLMLTTSCKISSIHGLVHILNSCKNIERLSWGVYEKCTVGGDDEHLMLPQCSLSHLKHVRINTLHGQANEIEFVKFLLKNSVVLEGIEIHIATDSTKRSIEESLRQFIEEEPSVRRSIKLHVL